MEMVVSQYVMAHAKSSLFSGTVIVSEYCKVYIANCGSRVPVYHAEVKVSVESD